MTGSRRVNGGSPRRPRLDIGRRRRGVGIAVDGNVDPKPDPAGRRDGRALTASGKAGIRPDVTSAESRRAFRLLCATSAIALVAEGVANVNLMPYAAGLGLPAAGLGLVFATHRLARLVASPGVGVLADRLGRRPPFLAGLLGSAVSLVALAYAAGLPGLFGARLLYGVASALTVVAGQASVLDLTPPGQRGRALGTYHAALYGVYPLGTLVGGFLVDTVGYTPAFLVLGAIVFAATGVGIWQVDETRARRDAALPPVAIGLSAYPRVLRGAVLRYTALKMLSGFAIWGVFESTFAIVLLARHGPEAVFAGARLGTRSLAGILLAVVISLGFLVGSPVVGRWTDRTGQRLPAVAAGLALTVLGLAGLALAGRAEVVGVVALVLGCAVALVSAPLAALVGDAVPPESRGAALAAYSTLGDIANAAGAVAGALLVAHAGDRATYLATAALVLVGGLGLLGGDGRRRLRV
jgi:MFS family permease